MGEGTGRTLLAAALDQLRAAGFDGATLWVLSINERARRFYEAAGWVADAESRGSDERCGAAETRYRIGLR